MTKLILCLITLSLFNSSSAQEAAGFMPIPNNFGLTWPNLAEPSDEDVKGFYHFRGNPSRSWYGVGPFPARRPEVKWRKGPFRSHYKAAITQRTLDAGFKIWTGTGWTGQPVVRTLDDGREEIIVGAYDRAVHFYDARNGDETREKYVTGGIIKGTVSLDPSGDPLLYTGPADGIFRGLRIDSNSPYEFYREHANEEESGTSKYAWDASAMVVGDYVFMGSENGLLYIYKTIKTKDSLGNLTDVRLEKISTVRSFTQKLIDEFRAESVGKKTNASMSIESSPVIFEDRVYVANSAGLISGFDINKLIEGSKREDALVFEYWAGDDIDSTMVVDEEGFLYVAVEDEVYSTRAQREAKERSGHFLKLNPYSNENPIVWSFKINSNEKVKGSTSAFYATPSINKTHIFITAHNGKLYVLDRQSGELVNSSIDLGYHTWSSSVLIENKLLVPMCQPAGLALFDVSNPRDIKELWKMNHPGGCIESTPLVWKGSIYVGSRDGYFYKFSD